MPLLAAYEISRERVGNPSLSRSLMTLFLAVSGEMFSSEAISLLFSPSPTHMRISKSLSESSSGMSTDCRGCTISFILVATRCTAFNWKYPTSVEYDADGTEQLWSVSVMGH